MTLDSLATDSPDSAKVKDCCATDRWMTGTEPDQVDAEPAERFEVLPVGLLAPLPPHCPLVGLLAAPSDGKADSEEKSGCCDLV